MAPVVQVGQKVNFQIKDDGPNGQIRRGTVTRVISADRFMVQFSAIGLPSLPNVQQLRAECWVDVEGKVWGRYV